MKEVSKTTTEGSTLLPDESIDNEERYGLSSFRVHKETGFTWLRVLVLVVQIVPALPLAGWILRSSPPPFGLPEGNTIRNDLVFAWVLVVLLAYEVKVLYIAKRQFMFVELFLVLPVVFPAILIYLSVFCTRKTNNPIGAVDIIAGVFVVFGTFLNGWPEIERMRWKKRPENRGKLYTEGFFSYVQNPNYLGDVFWTAGWALASSWVNLWIPIMIMCVLSSCTFHKRKESYLAKPYASELPFIY